MVVQLERGESVTVESEVCCGVPGAKMVLIVNADGEPQVSMAGKAMSVSQQPTHNSAMVPCPHMLGMADRLAESVLEWNETCPDDGETISQKMVTLADEYLKARQPPAPNSAGRRGGGR